MLVVTPGYSHTSIEQTLPIDSLLVLSRVDVHSMYSAILFYHSCLSVCLSVRHHAVALYLNEGTYSQIFPTTGRGVILVF